MAATTDFVPFATAVGANVTSQADWIAETTTGTGFQSGEASSADCNKAWRQGTFIGAAVANFIANQLNTNVPDDGNLTNAITSLTNAVIQAASNASNITSGTLSVARFPGIIGSNTTGNAATATLAASVTPASTSANVNFNVAMITGNEVLYASLTYNPATETLFCPGTIETGTLDVTVVNATTITASGNIEADYLEQTSANDENPVVSQIMVTNGTDNVLRKANASTLATALGVASGSWTTTLSGGWVTGPSGTLNWSKNETHASIWCDASITLATTVPGSININAVPSAICPASNRIVTCATLENNGALNQAGACEVQPGGTILVNFLSGTGYTGGAVGGGVAGISAGWSITYPL